MEERTRSPPSSDGIRAKAWAIRSSESAKVRRRSRRPRSESGPGRRPRPSRSRRGAPAAAGGRRAGSPGSASRARGRGGGSRRACRSSCAPDVSAPRRTPGRLRSPLPSPAVTGPDPVAQAGEVRGAGDRDLRIVEVGARAHERERLEGLRRGAEVRQETRISGCPDDSAALDCQSVHVVSRLDDVAAPDDYADRVVHDGSVEVGVKNEPTAAKADAWGVWPVAVTARPRQRPASGIYLRLGFAVQRIPGCGQRVCASRIRDEADPRLRGN